MDRSALTRRGALSAAFGSAAALAVPATAQAATAPEAAVGTSALLPAVPRGKRLHLSYADADSTTARKASARKASARLGDTPPTDDFSTFGWDTVSVIALTDVNNAIAKYGTSPSAWDGTVPGTKFSPPVVLNGQFDPWTLATGGTGGGEVVMRIPFGADLGVGNRGDETVYGIRGGTATVEVDLAFDPERNLRVDTQPDTEKPLAVITHLEFVSPPAGGLEPGEHDWLVMTLTQLLDQWLNDPTHLAAFEHVFTAIDINSAESMGNLAWLLPTHTDYAYFNGTNDDDSFLGVLCMTEKRDPGRAPQELAPGAMVVGQERWSGLTVSKDRFMNKMLLPGLRRHFPGVDIGINDSGAFTAASEFRMDKLVVDGNSYQPVATEFTVSVDYDRITTNMQLLVPVNSHISGHAWIEYAIQPTLGKNSQGEACLTYEVIQQNIQHWVVTDGVIGEFELWLAKVADGIDGILRAAMNGLGLKFLAGMVSFPFDSLEDWDADEALDHLPTADAFAQQATLPIAWKNADVLRPAQVRLHNGALQIFGPTFP
ncbi:TULIP family P47-like protein [Streptomyces griseiscabiei]|uniref:TULIP family P47-like protein n=3 Tax=Streptomyces griseiscabiei TaxID=2993540 RepID=A0ABU4KZU4_9ACTN|nr:TULIP family P47-like protein [Streptomyces griseiscabiei]MBZ3900882.1 TULIP family P47-like protein [Streptomyces griseiscabiei]MDX2908989.1 TULIP family P47-like protein [Streptomyces griseiscabiei]